MADTMGEDVITDMGAIYSRDLEGHWHWITDWRNVKTIRLDPPMPGRSQWNCLCSAEPTHYTREESGNYVIGDRVAIPHREW